MVEIARDYAPGACNISKEEERVRLATGWIGTVLTVAGAAGLVAAGVAPLWRLVLFLPAALAASGFLQAGLHFCANFGMRGVVNMGSEVGKTTAVADPAFARQDRAKALLIVGLATLIGAVVAGGALLLP